MTVKRKSRKRSTNAASRGKQLLNKCVQHQRVCTASTDVSTRMWANAQRDGRPAKSW